MSTAYAAIGTQLWIGDGGSPEQFFKVAKTQDYDGPGMTRDTIDVTTQDTVNQYKEFIASLKDGGEVTFPLVFDPAEVTHNETVTTAATRAGGVKYLFEQGVKRNMRLVLPVSPAYRFSFIGLVTAFKPNMKVLGALMANVTIKVSGGSILEAGSANGA